MSTFVRCVGCGEPLYGHPCRWCTCERCGNDLRDGYCFLCHSRNGDSFTYDSTPNSFDNPPDFSYPPPQPQYVPYSCELCGNDAHHGYDCPPQELAEYINTPNWNRPTVYYDDDDDEDYTIAITPVLSTKEPDNSLSMADEHLDTVPATESDKVIKSSVEILVPIPSESEGIPDKMCDVPFHDNSPPLDISKDQFEDFSESNDDFTSIDEDSFSIDNIDYVGTSPPDSKLVSLEVAGIVISKVGGIDTGILQTIKGDILREKLLNVNLLIAKIEALKDNPTPPSNFMTKSSSTSPNFFLEETNTVDNSLPETEMFCFNLEEISSGSPTSYSDLSLPDYEAFYLDDNHVEEKSSGSTTTHADFSQYDSFIFDLSINPCPPADRSDCYHEEFAGELAHIISPPEYDCFYFKNEPDQGNFTMDVVEDIFDNPTREPRVHVPNVLAPPPTLHLDLNFILSMIDTLLPFSSENENKVVNTGILASEEKSPPSSSHRGFKASKLSHHKSPMLIHGDNTPNLGVRHPHFYPP
ncbi:hypothetical protein Tco_1132799 [Tanacetum coccineum]|uniref:Pre-mRNA splicing Prp18-interacting factor n=1 Tax=Tanacetum coccineum TaxID=301880 RepID=A0ABQ5JD35_9ASTR